MDVLKHEIKENIIKLKDAEIEKQKIIVELEKQKNMVEIEKSNKKDIQIELLQQKLYIKELETTIKNL